MNFLAQAPDARTVEALTNAASMSATGANLNQVGCEQKIYSIGLAASQIEWMRSASAQRGVSSPEKFASTVVQACMKVDDAAAIFDVIRCKTATASRGTSDVAGLADSCTVCAGAQQALVAQGVLATSETGSRLEFRAATSADRERAMQVINSAYMEEAFIKMPFAEERISAETFDAAIANESGRTVWTTPVHFSLASWLCGLSDLLSAGLWRRRWYLLWMSHLELQ
eukprot:COSAG02_NODE_8492_length_2551_cov_1.455954_4_plen_227_part_00